PPGRHTLTFDPTAPLLLRALRQEDPGYLLPGYNAPRPSAGQLRAKGVADVLRLSPWGLTPRQMASFSTAGPLAVAEEERVAVRLARDNSRREGGLLGAALLDAAAVERPDYPRVRVAAEKLRGFHTFYRDLVPRAKSTADPQTFAWFLTPRLLNSGEPARPARVPRQHADDILDRLAGGLFLRVPSPGEAPLGYPVPERFGPSWLRVAVEAADQPREFHLQ